jgi:hypothetical protein
MESVMLPYFIKPVGVSVGPESPHRIILLKAMGMTDSSLSMKILTQASVIL